MTKQVFDCNTSLHFLFYFMFGFDLFNRSDLNNLLLKFFNIPRGKTATANERKGKYNRSVMGVSFTPDDIPMFQQTSQQGKVYLCN